MSIIESLLHKRSSKSNYFQSQSVVKMKPLELNQKALIWLFMCSADKTVDRRKKILYFFCFLLVLFVNMAALIAATKFALKFFSTDLEECLYAFFQISAIAGIVYVMLAAFLLRHKISTIFTQLSDIYAASKRLFLEYICAIHFITKKTLLLKSRWKKWCIPFFGASQYQRWLFLYDLCKMYGNNFHKYRFDVRHIGGSLLVFERKFWYPVFISSIQIYVSEINECIRMKKVFFLKIQWTFVKCTQMALGPENETGLFWRNYDLFAVWRGLFDSKWCISSTLHMYQPKSSCILWAFWIFSAEIWWIRCKSQWKSSHLRYYSISYFD